MACRNVCCIVCYLESQCVMFLHMEHGFFFTATTTTTITITHLILLLIGIFECSR